MSSVSQNADGTYVKSYSDTELYIINSLAQEVKARVKGDQLLWIDITGVTNRVKTLEDKDVNIDKLQQELVNAIGAIEGNAREITRLDKLLGVEAYSKSDMDKYIVGWKVEQIPHRFATPTNEMFDKIDIDDLQSGYVNYLNGDINEPHDNHIPENTMRRFTLSAYVETPREVTFRIHYADRLNVYMNGVSEAIYTDTLGNFGSTKKVLPLMLKEGWNKFQFLISNETQRGGLVIESDLFEKADYLSNLDDLSGMITGDRIQAGTLDETHFSPNMDLVVNTLTATADNVPGVMIGDPNGCGILQIGDKTITKCINEPFVFDDGIRVNGYIYVSQLLIDVDFILQGDGILIEKIKDAATGFTRAYVIHNDLRVLNGGGLTIVGDGRKGFTFTNAMKLIGDQKLGGMPINPEPNESGLDISGDAVKGYYIRNAMLMTVEGTGGLLITGNPQTGYWIKNTMNLSAYKGLKVEGDPSTAAGYVLKNQMGMTGDGVKVTPTPLNTDYVYNWHIENDTKIDVGLGLDVQKLAAGHFKLWNILEVTGDGIGVTTTGSKSTGFSKHHLTNNTSITPTCLGSVGAASTGGGLSVVKDGAGQFRIGNAMKFLVNNTGPASISGDACSGYSLNVLWPTLIQRQGISITNNIPGRYEIENSGVINVLQGNAGIKVTARDAQGAVYVSNEGVIGLIPGTAINISGAGAGTYQISTPAVTHVSSQGDISASISNNTLYLSYEAPEPPPPIIIQPPTPDPPASTDPGTPSLGPGGGSIANLGHGSPVSTTASSPPFMKTAKTASSTGAGIANGNLTWNDSTRFSFSLQVGAHGDAVSGGKIRIDITNGQNGTGTKIGDKTFSVPDTSKMQIGSTNPVNVSTISISFNKSEFPGIQNQFYVGVFAEPSLIGRTDIVTRVSNAGQFS